MNIKNTMMKSVLLAAVMLAAHQNAMAAAAEGMRIDRRSDQEQESQVLRATGTVQAIDEAAGTVTLAHEPVPALNWPAMTMAFKVADHAAEHVRVGQTVEFEFTSEGMNATISKIEIAD